MSTTIKGLLDEATREYARDREQIKIILDNAESQGRKSLTADEDRQAEELLARCERNQSKIEKLKALQAEDDEVERRFEQAKTIKRGIDTRIDYETRADQAGRFTQPAEAGGSRDNASALFGVPVQRDNNWSREDGLPATVGRGQRFADHALVKRDAAANAERDRILIGTHGSFAQQLRAMTTSGASAVVPTLWSSQIIDRARNAAVVMQAGATLVPMESKTLQLGRLTADPAPAFKTEGNPAAASDLAYDFVQLTAQTVSIHGVPGIGVS